MFMKSVSKSASASTEDYLSNSAIKFLYCFVCLHTHTHPHPPTHTHTHTHTHKQTIVTIQQKETFSQTLEINVFF